MKTIEKFFGMSIGGMLGDAVGRYLEHGSKRSVASKVSRENFPFPAVKVVGSAIPECHWTDDTDQFLLILEMLTETSNKIDIHLFAKKLVNWYKNGRPDFGYTYGIGIGNQTRNVLDAENYLENPLEVSKRLSRGYLSGNGSVMRCGAMAFRGLDYETTIRESVIISQTTHNEVRCCVAVAVITSILWDLFNGTDENVILDRARKMCNVEGTFVNPMMTAENFSYKQECEKYFDETNIENLRLEDQEGYSLKTMSCGVYAFRNRNRPYREVMLDIFLEGGDTDTNGIVAGCVWGARNGTDGLENEWFQKIPHQNWFVGEILKFIEMLEKNKNFKN